MIPLVTNILREGNEEALKERQNCRKQISGGRYESPWKHMKSGKTWTTMPLAKKGVCVFSWIYSGKNAYALFGQGHHCGGFASFPVLWRRFESTSWNLFPAMLPCFQILFVAFPQNICGRELSFLPLQVCELQCPWAPCFNSLFWELAAKAHDCFRPSSGSRGQAELVLNSSSWWENRVTCACPNT